MNLRVVSSVRRPWSSNLSCAWAIITSGRPHLDSDNGRQPAAAVVLVVRLVLLEGLAPDRSAAHRAGAGDLRHHPPETAQTRRPRHRLSPSHRDRHRLALPAPGRLRSRRVPGCAHRPAEPEAARRRANDPHSRGRPRRLAMVADPQDTPLHRETDVSTAEAGQNTAPCPPDLTPRPPRQAEAMAISMRDTRDSVRYPGQRVAIANTESVSGNTSKRNIIIAGEVIYFCSSLSCGWVPLRLIFHKRRFHFYSRRVGGGGLYFEMPWGDRG